MSLRAWIHIEEEIPPQGSPEQILVWGRHCYGKAKAWVLEWDAESTLWCLPESHDPVVFQWWIRLPLAPIGTPSMIGVTSQEACYIP